MSPAFENRMAQPTVAQNTAPYTGPKASDIYNPQSELMQGLENPTGAPTASPTPGAVPGATPTPRKTGWDYFRSLFGLA
jgi:hypothetical protein